MLQSFLDRTAAARRPETARRRHGWDNPGRPGKGWWQLVPPSPPSPRKRRAAGICHQFLWSESCPASSPTNQELCGEARLEAVLSRVRSTESFDPQTDAVTHRVEVATAKDQNVITPPAGRPRQKARSARTGRVKEEQSRGVSGLGKARQPPHQGGVKNASPHCRNPRNLRGKRSDP